MTVNNEPSIDYKKRQEIEQSNKSQTIKNYFENNMSRLLEIVGNDPKIAARFITLALTTIRLNKGLLDCDPASLFGAFLQCSAVNLEIDKRDLAYLVPYGKEATFIIGYKGLRALALRSGKIRNIYAEVVYESEAENFNIELGLRRHLTHTFNFMKPRTGKIVCSYAVAVYLDDSEPHFEYCLQNDIDKARQSSKTATVWNSHPAEMWKKTAIRKLCKGLDLSTEVAEAIYTEDKEHYKDSESTASASVIDIKAISEKADMSIYEPPAIEAEPTPQPTPQQIDDHAKACVRLDELAEENKHLVDKFLAGRNPDNLTVDEIWGVIDAVEDSIK